LYSPRIAPTIGNVTTAPSRIQTFSHDSPLGSWRVSLWHCDPRLAGIVATMWFGEGSVHYQRDRILPSGQSQLLINLGPTQYRIEPGPPERRVPFVDIWYSGLHQGPIDTEAPHGNALLGVAFSPLGAYPWLGPQLDGLGDRIIALADALGDGALALRERLLNTTSVAARFACVERWLLARLSPRCLVHPAVRWAVDRIVDSGGRIPIATLARETGFTRKHLGNLFLRQVGMSAKAVARVHRFRGAMALLDVAEQVPWAELADLCGYYDQSHLINEFRAFSGFAPTELVRRQRPDAQSVVLR
jgi:AraC-like DNA-binding protein